MISLKTRVIVLPGLATFTVYMYMHVHECICMYVHGAQPRCSAPGACLYLGILRIPRVILGLLA